MHHIPHPKDQAETLMRIAKARGWELGKQAALEVVAEMQGHKNWQICSAAVNVALADKQAQLKLEPALVIEDPDDEDGQQLFVGTVTMEATMSAEFGVWAADAYEARGKLLDFAVDRYQMNGGSDFVFDDGNYRDSDDFYLPDADAIENRSLDIECDGDMSARATWQDERGSYDVIFSRDEPDCSDDERRGAVTVTLSVKPNIKGAPELTKEYTGEEGHIVADGELSSQLRSDVEEGNFDTRIEQLLKKALRDMQHRPRITAK
jgi:hypothetical protein